MARPVNRARVAAADHADDKADAVAGPQKPLTKEMRAATRTLHHAANALVLAKLAVALNDRVTYGRALASFHPVYSELERLLRLHASHSVLGPVARAALPLARAQAMEEDLVFLLGGGGAGGNGQSTGADGDGKEQQQEQQQRRPTPVAGWRWAAASSSSAQAYASDLRELSEEDPALLIPYAWSLYVPVTLGFMGRRVAKGLGLPPPLSTAAAAETAATATAGASSSSPSQLPSAGLRFFDLQATAGLDGTAALARLRAAVDSAGERLSPATRRRVVAEAQEQFRRNNSVVMEFPLGVRDVWRAVGRGCLIGLVVVVAVAMAVVWRQG
jgi:heme oxygenase